MRAQLCEINMFQIHMQDPTPGRARQPNLSFDIALCIMSYVFQLSVMEDQYYTIEFEFFCHFQFKAMVYLHCQQTLYTSVNVRDRSVCSLDEL
jgi:hypothetical protein